MSVYIVGSRRVGKPSRQRQGLSHRRCPVHLYCFTPRRASAVTCDVTGVASLDAEHSQVQIWWVGPVKQLTLPQNEYYNTYINDLVDHCNKSQTLNIHCTWSIYTLQHVWKYLWFVFHKIRKLNINHRQQTTYLAENCQQKKMVW